MGQTALPFKASVNRFKDSAVIQKKNPILFSSKLNKESYFTISRCSAIDFNPEHTIYD